MSTTPSQPGNAQSCPNCGGALRRTDAGWVHDVSSDWACPGSKGTAMATPPRDALTRYDRLGVDGAKAGLYVRFEPGFGLNVIVGYRHPVHTEPGPRPSGWRDGDELAMSLGGWEQLGRLVDQWRAREEALNV